MGVDNRASRSNRCCGCQFRRFVLIVAVDAEKIVAVDADFDAPTRLKNEYDRNKEENESVVELFSV